MCRMAAAQGQSVLAGMAGTLAVVQSKGPASVGSQINPGCEPER